MTNTKKTSRRDAESAEFTQRILFRTRIYRIPRIDDERLLTPPLAALTPPLRWEGS